MFDFAAAYASARPYREFLDKYGNPEQRRRWDEFHAGVALSDKHKELLASFTREMKVLVMAGAWCGDCVNQCPIFEHFAAATPTIHVRYADRDDSNGLSSELTTCGGARAESPRGA